jgi:site-specific recombinase XerD
VRLFAAQPLFPTITGKALSRDAVEHRIAVYVTTARRSCPSLRTKKITVHTLRHTSAMRLLLSGVDVFVIALWLGHEQVSTTNIYLHADMTQQERAIARVPPKVTKPGRYLAPDSVMAFLDTL